MRGVIASALAAGQLAADWRWRRSLPILMRKFPRQKADPFCRRLSRRCRSRGNFSVVEAGRIERPGNDSETTDRVRSIVVRLPPCRFI
jgi:hypothetical protein